MIYTYTIVEGGNGLAIQSCLQDFKAGYDYAIENDPRVKIAIDILKENDRSCDFDLIQKTVDGVFLQGTKHNENCRRCRLIKALEGGEK